MKQNNFKNIEEGGGSIFQANKNSLIHDKKSSTSQVFLHSA